MAAAAAATTPDSPAATPAATDRPPATTEGRRFGDASFGGLLIQPSNPTLAVNGPGVTQQFTAYEGSTQVSPQWTIDVADIGTIDATGLFTASGLVGGPTTVTAMSGNLKATTLLTVKLSITRQPRQRPRGHAGAADRAEAPPTRRSSGSIRTTARSSRAASARRCSRRPARRADSTRPTCTSASRGSTTRGSTEPAIRGASR